MEENIKELFWDNPYPNTTELLNGDIDKINRLSEELFEVIQKYKPTYKEAYASLRYVYSILKYQSNFVPVETQPIEIRPNVWL